MGEGSSLAAACTDTRQRRLYNTHMDITLPELEQAINYWRSLRPSTGEEHALSPEVNALATVYALMIFHQIRVVQLDTLDDTVRKLIDAWRRQSV